MSASAKGPVQSMQASVSPVSSDGRDLLIVPLSGYGPKPPLFLIHGVDGGLRHLGSLADSLRLDRQVYGIRSYVLAGRPVSLTTVQEIARFYLAEIRKVQPAGPYYFIGFSFGGFVAYEMAQDLHQAGEEVAMLGMIDSLIMGSAAASGQAAAPAGPARGSSSTLMAHFKKTLSPSGLSYARDKIIRRAFRLAYVGLEKLRRPIPLFLQRAEDVNWYAGVRYVPGPCSSKLTLFFSNESIEDGRAQLEFWQSLARGGAEVRPIEGPHDDLMWQPGVNLLARQIEDALDRVP